MNQNLYPYHLAWNWKVLYLWHYNKRNSCQAYGVKRRTPLVSELISFQTHFSLYVTRLKFEAKIIMKNRQELIAFLSRWSTIKPTSTKIWAASFIFLTSWSEKYSLIQEHNQKNSGANDISLKWKFWNLIKPSSRMTIL